LLQIADDRAETFLGRFAEDMPRWFLLGLTPSIDD
jgi:hypothetical protein